MKFWTKLILLFVFLLIFFFNYKVSLASNLDFQIDCENNFDQIEDGILYKKVTTTSPVKLVYYITKIDIENDNLDFAITPEIYTKKTTSEFANLVGATVAINGDLFDRTTYIPLGRAASQGDFYHNADNEPSIYISEENEIVFKKPQVPVWDIISGSTTIVEKGEIANKLFSCAKSEYCAIDDPRTALGITKNNKLIIFTVDGRSSLSNGVSLIDLGELLVQCKAETAINMDGGGSTTLFSQGSVMNVPSDGSERIVSNHFAVCLGSCILPPPPPPGGLPYSVQGDARPRYKITDNYPFPCDKRAPDDSFLNAFPGIDNLGDDEFHSYRPYQVSPCNKDLSDIALFCGNTLVLSQTVDVSKKFDPNLNGTYGFSGNPINPNDPDDWGLVSPCKYCAGENNCVNSPEPACIEESNQCTTNADCTACKNNGNGTETCAFTIEDSREIAIDLSGAELPIMGYTEPSKESVGSGDPEVVNSVNPGSLSPDETMSYEDRVNEYVSWYLNGVNANAEYPLLDTTKDCIGESTGIHGVCKPSIGVNTCTIPNGVWQFDGKAGCGYSTGNLGGLQPVVPEYCCINKADDLLGKNEPQLDRDRLINLSGPINKLLPQRIQNDKRSKQVKDAVTSRTQDTKIRHDQVVGCTYDVKIFGVALHSVPGPCYIEGVVGTLSRAFRTEHYLSQWKDKLPPTEESSGIADWYDYYYKTRKWRGDFCFHTFAFPESVEIFGYEFKIDLPFLINKEWYLCFNNPLSPDFFSTMFQMIPMTSTEDRRGEVAIKRVQIQPPISSKFTILWSTITDTQPAKLFFSHMQESDQLGEILQSTYAPQDADLLEVTEPGLVNTGIYCEAVQARSNPGDDLFAGEITATVNFAVQSQCDFHIPDPNLPGNICENVAEAVCTSQQMKYCENYFGAADCSGGYICAKNCEDNPYNPPPNPSNTCESLGFECKPSNWSSGNCSFVGQLGCPTNYSCSSTPSSCTFPTEAIPDEMCSNPIFINVDLITKTPLAENVWARFVAGSTSVFRRIFPKIGPDSLIKGLWDIPAATGVKYSSPDGSIGAGSPGSGSSGSDAQLYFPHIGGIREYFLGGIQGLLRPKGYGDQIITSDPTTIGAGNGGTGSGGGTGTSSCSGEEPPSIPPDPITAPMCEIATVGWCSIDMIKSHWPADLRSQTTEEDYRYASIVCNAESGGWSNQLNDGCLCGKSYDYSIGLFQINLLAHCPEAFSQRSTSPISCTIGDESVLKSCSDKYFDPIQNIEYAARLWYDSGKIWSAAWSVAKPEYCNLP